MEKKEQPQPERRPSAEIPDAGAEIPLEIREILEAHIKKLTPASEGRRELVSALGNAALGAAEVTVDRAVPAIDIEFAALTPGKSKVLIGPNGAGKTTLLDALMERGAHFDTHAGRGATVVGKPVHRREYAQVARLDQEEMLGRLGSRAAREVLEHTARYFKAQFPIDPDWADPEKYERNMANQETHTRIDTLMGQVTKLFDMDEFLDTPVEKLSGGERTKLALFMVLLSEPDTFLFDEPTNHLDLQSIAKLTALFSEYKKAGAAILSVSHVDWFLQDSGTEGVLEIVWDKKARTLRDTNKSFTAWMKNPAREQMPIISRDIEWTQKDYEYKRGELLVETPPVFSIPDSPLTDAKFPSIRGGDLVMLGGNNGSGKSKLMETIVYNKKVTMPHKAGGQMAYLPQFWPEELMGGSLRDFFHWVKKQASPLSKGSAYHPDSPAEKFFVKLASDLSFGGSTRIGDTWMNRPFRQFSGGEQRLLWFLAVSSLRDVDMLVLDEPTNHMDRYIQEKVARTIRTFPGAVLLSTHDRTLIGSLSRDAGTFQGQLRSPVHIVLEKRSGRTSVAESKESPIAYMERKMEEARAQAKRFKV